MISIMEFNTINELLAEYEKDGAISDIHISGDASIAIRRIGEIQTVEDSYVTSKQMEEFLRDMLKDHK